MYKEKEAIDNCINSKGAKTFSKFYKIEKLVITSLLKNILIELPN